MKKYAILRIAGIYGLNGSEHLGLNKSIREAVCNHIVPTLKGSGNARRNYICVLDVVRWIFTLLQKCETKDRPAGDIYYLADPEIYSIRGYLEAIVNVFMPSEKIKMIEGADGRDAIVNCSPPPFLLTKFLDYLYTIKSKEYVAS